MANRDTTNGSTTPKPTGPEFLDEYSGHIGVLFNNSVLPLTSVTGADTITASVDPTLPSGGLATGMKFSITWAADNTGAATLNIGGTGAVSIVGKSGEALAAGQLAEDMRDILEYDGTNFILVTGGADTGESITGITAYTYSDTWTNDYPDNTIVMVECWGAGGGGTPTGAGGGGGGAYQRGFFRAGDLPSTVAITVPAGAAAGADGGSCTFGAYLEAHGGKAPSGAGGVGGGVGPSGNIVSGVFGGGDGGYSSPNQSGKTACWGGGGGMGTATGVGGGSEYGGAGGGVATAGSAPGGGGGYNGGAGARGECRVTVSKGQFMRVAQIDGGVVTNVLLINPARVPDHLKDMPEAPDHVGVGWTYDGEFHAPASAIAADDVKAEASRRIIDLCPEWKQRNLTAQAAILAAKGRDNWTDEEQAAWDAGEALWAQISAIRAASDQIEAMDPIPQDFTDDKYWG